MAAAAVLQFCPDLLYSGSCTTANCPLKHDVKLCELCAAICTPAQIYQSHIRSPAHQQRARMQPLADELPPSTKRCVLCYKIIHVNSWSAHVRGEDHKRHERIATYKAAFEQAERDKEGVTVSHAEGIAFGVVDIGRTRRGTSIKVLIRSTSSRVSVVRTAVTMNGAREQTITPFSLLIEGGQHITAGQDKLLIVSLIHDEVGQFEGRVDIEFRSGSQRPFMISRQVRAVIGDAADHEALKPTTPYVRHGRVPWKQGQRYYSGQRPPALAAVPWVKKLKQYPIPAAIIAAVSKKPPAEAIAALRAHLPRQLNTGTHGARFKPLLWVEELRMDQDLRMYDMVNVSFVKEGRLYYLVVPGLAEKRPSVIIGDRIQVQPSESTQTAGKCFEGWVHTVRRDDVGLDFHASFKPAAVQRFNVRFTLNRIPYRRQHQALGAVPPAPQRYLFPEVRHIGLSSIPSAADIPLTPINALVGTNAAQLQAVRCILRLKSSAAPFIVFGPPGTGKTVTIVEAMRQILVRHPQARILACAPSNSAADIITERLGLSDKELFRFYAVTRNQAQTPPGVLQYTHTNANGYFACPPVDKLARFRVIVSTCGSASFTHGVGLQRGHFTHIFIDEAGQATEAEVMTSIKPIAAQETQIVLSGDPKQLGPIIRSAVARGLNFGTSYLERMMERPIYTEPQRRGLTMVKLVKNFRSHEAILRFPNDKFYEGELQACGAREKVNALVGWRHLVNPKFPVMFHAVQGKDEREASSPSYFNIDEITVGKDYVQKLAGHDIGIIAPYNAQVRKFRTALRNANLMNDIKVASVEEFQGDEHEVIILSTVRSSRELLEYDARYALGFVSNPRRFNVAVTRAQALLVVIGDPTVLSLDPLWRQFLNYIYSNGGWRGSPPTWNTEVPVDDNEDFAQQLREQSIGNVANFVTQVMNSAGDDGVDEESGANANLVMMNREG